MAYYAEGRYTLPALTGSRPVFTARQHVYRIFFRSLRSRTFSIHLRKRGWPLLLNWLFVWPAHVSDASAAHGVKLVLWRVIYKSLFTEKSVSAQKHSMYIQTNTNIWKLQRIASQSVRGTTVGLTSILHRQLHSSRASSSFRRPVRRHTVSPLSERCYLF